MSLNSKTTLVVDWFKCMGTDAMVYVAQYDTSSVPFKILKDGVWKETQYECVEHIESIGGDVVWQKELSK